MRSDRMQKLLEDVRSELLASTSLYHKTYVTILNYFD